MGVPTVDEILARTLARRKDDMFGFEWHEYVEYLPFDKAKPLLLDGTEVTETEWKKLQPELTEAAVLEKMRKYMPFAWDKANGCRGLSSNRSIMHYIAWTWLHGDAEFSEEIQKEFDENYCMYGKPILVKICERYGWDWKQWDDDRWRNGEDEDEYPVVTATQALKQLR